MKLYFAGAEVPTWRRLLVAENVPHVAVNYLHLRPRISAGWKLSAHFPPEVSIFLDSGAAGARRKRWNRTDHEEYLREYQSFVLDNMDRLDYYTEYDALEDLVDGQRNVWGGMDKYVPVWREEQGAPVLRTMVQYFSNLAVPALSDQAQNVVGSLVRGGKLKLHGLAFSHPWDAPGGIYTSIVSSSWISPTRYGETQVWDTNRLRRYPAEDKDKVRRRHRSKFTAAGFDAAAILADDNREVARYTIWAWCQLEQHLAPIATIGTDGRGSGTPPSGNGSVAIDLAAPPGNGSALPAEIRPLPVFDFRPTKVEVPSTDGLGTTEISVDVAVMARGGLRQCDSCSLATVCPEYTHGASCRFSIPVEIRNREQLMSVLHSLLEMQSQRVAFGFFAEQLQGGYPDANLSSELDRMMRMTQAVKEIQDNRDFLRVTVEGRAQAGVLRRLFGAERAETLHRVDSDRAETAVRRTMGT